jgi:recombination protein RecA
MLDQVVEKVRALRTLLVAIEKQFGKGAVMTLSEDEEPEPVAAISTGSLALDLATGIGGIPRGRVVEVYGPESSGKTTLALHAIAEAQRNGGAAAFIDAEHALDVAYARGIGVETDKLLISQPDTGEQALDITEMLVRSGAIDLVVTDSRPCAHAAGGPCRTKARCGMMVSGSSRSPAETAPRGEPRSRVRAISVRRTPRRTGR